jgi:hypothetical protein
METTTPILIERTDDLGWLALTPNDYPRAFAVDGKTAEEATRKFEDSLAHWESIGSARPVKRSQSIQ